MHPQLENEGPRRGLQHVYRRLKRNKVLRSVEGWDIAVLDGHESRASYRCLQGTVHTAQGERIQFYHRQVVLMLRCEKIHLLLDVEDEVAAAVRLLQACCRLTRDPSSC